MMETKCPGHQTQRLWKVPDGKHMLSGMSNSESWILFYKGHHWNNFSIVMKLFQNLKKKPLESVPPTHW